MAETRRKRAALAIGGEGVGAELGRLRQRVAREGAVKLATLKPANRVVHGERRLSRSRKSFSELAKMLDTPSNENDVGRLASDIEQMLSAAQRVLEEDSAPSPPTEADLDEAVTVPAPLVAPRADAAAVPPATAAKAVSQLEAEPLEELLSALDAARDSGSCMSFVPAIVRRLNASMPVPAALELLLHAARRELIELRPEGGLGRLSDEELALCPPGPAGTRLSWARRSAGAAA